MQVIEALNALGTTSVIWVDDKFNRTPRDLAKLLIRDREVAAECGFAELKAVFEKAEVDQGAAQFDLEQLLEFMEPQRVDEIRTTFFKHETIAQRFSTAELSDEAVEKICNALQVTPEKRWTFDRATEELSKLEDGADEGTTYVVDLNEAGGPKTRGLDILQQLQAKNSRGIAFILTHDATTTTESEREAQLRQILVSDDGDPVKLPMCVIAKERLFNSEDDEGLRAGLLIGLKRAAVRKSLFDVVNSARETVRSSFEGAADRLLDVIPEQLEAFVFERGYKEGVSELHVLERILTAQISQSVRHFFGTNDAALKSAFRLRALRTIQLSAAGLQPDPNLSGFRKAEIWEDDELINQSYSPIACGDVFEFDKAENGTANIPRRFVLLAQPCDISLRPDGRRAQELGFLVQLKKREDRRERTVKVYPLPFKLDGEQWACDFHNSTVVRLSVLDLASFRPDGRVRVDADHVLPSALLVSQQTIYKDRTAGASKILKAGKAVEGGGLLTDGLQLCVSQASPFKQIFAPTFVPVIAPRPSSDLSDNKRRVTWRLRRCGRIRHPYVSALLDEFLDVMGRHAFDVDFMDLDLVADQNGPLSGKADAAAETAANNEKTGYSLR